MSKELEYKIKINKRFDKYTESEVSSYYVKKKLGIFWKTVTDSDELSNFLGASFVLAIIAVSVTLGVLEIKMQYKGIWSLLNTVYSMLALFPPAFFICSYLSRRNFQTEENALEFIKTEIRKSNLPTYNTTQDIKIKYKDGELEMIK